MERLTDEELEEMRAIVRQLFRRMETGQGDRTSAMCRLPAADARLLLDEVERLREERDLQPCPACKGEGGERRRMGYLGEEVEYCECEFCDDQMEMTALQIAERQLEINQQYDGHMEAEIKELREERDRYIDEVDRLRTGTDVQRTLCGMTDDELREDKERLQGLRQDYGEYAVDIAVSAINDELRRRGVEGDDVE